MAFRKVLLESSGLVLAVSLSSVLALAFLGGVIFKGKSGWCSQFCRMLQILIGHAELSEPVTRAVEANLDVTPVLGPLERGDWSVLSTS